MSIPMAGQSALHVAVLTPGGRGAVATVWIEGDRAVEAVQRCFQSASGRPLAETADGKIAFGHWASGEEVVLCRRGEAVEVHCHGGHQAVRAIVRSLISRGAKEVPWSEWVAGQYQDAITAEAAVALAHARTERTANILLDQFHGALSREIARIDELVHAGKAAGAAEAIDELLQRAPLGLHLCQPWRVVLAGATNVGKSSLINALLGYRRAIVFDQPGTTRDAVTAGAAIDGWPVVLADTAGLREAADCLEQAGIAETHRQIAAADLVIHVRDATDPRTWANAAGPGDTAQGRASLLVYNKCDLPASETAPCDAPCDGPCDGLLTSAVTGEGVAALVEAMASRLVPNPPPAGAAVPFTQRQVDELERTITTIRTRGTSESVSELLRNSTASPGFHDS